MPYIYSLAGMTWLNDYTIMRALVMDFSDDAAVSGISDQYMFGPALMACPVYAYGARSRDVYFPGNDGWYDLYSGTHISGNQTISVDAPYERMPLFVRAGSIVPIGPEIMYSDEKQPETITLFIYGGRDGSFTLYEDEGVNYNYEKGKYATISFTYHDADKTLEIGEREGTFNGMLKERKFNIVYVDQENPKAMQGDATGIQIDYTGTAEKANL